MALLRSLRRAIIPSLRVPLSSFPFLKPPPLSPPLRLNPIGSGSGSTSSTALHLPRSFSTTTMGALFSHLTDTRFPKRRPGFKSRRKRASLRPRGPYAWVQYTPGEPIPASQPNAGSVKRRNEKKRIMQRKAFMLAEKKKRRAQYSAHLKRKEVERTERKMAAVAREKAWAERLIELQQLEEAKKAAMA